MTLQKVKTGNTYPFLIPMEAQASPKVIVKFSPRTAEMKDFNTGEKVPKTVVEVELQAKFKKSDYETTDLEDDNIEQRLSDPVRTWIMNGRSLNHLIDTFGENEEKWVGQTIELEVLKQIVKGKKRQVIYAKGSVQED